MSMSFSKESGNRLTYGGWIVARSQLRALLFFSKNAHAAFSARYLLALYFQSCGAAFPCALTALIACSFQSSSENTWGVGASCRIVAHETVTTMRLTEDLREQRPQAINRLRRIRPEIYTYPYFSALSRMPTVPFTAGSISSVK